MLSIFIYSLVGRWPCNTIQNCTQQGRGPLCELQKGFHLWANLESNYVSLPISYIHFLILEVLLFNISKFPGDVVAHL